MSTNERTGRGRSDDILAAELASGATVTEAAIKAGVSEATAYRRLRDAEFSAQVRELRSAAVRAAAGRLAGTMAKAVEVLASLLDSATEPTRLRAADRLLDHGVKVSEVLELEQRVEALERVLTMRAKG